jgi:hypothetical protein
MLSKQEVPNPGRRMFLKGVRNYGMIALGVGLFGTEVLGNAGCRNGTISGPSLDSSEERHYASTFELVILQQTIMANLGPKYTVDTPSNKSRLGKAFQINGSEYTFLLDKEDLKTPDMEGYKRTIRINKNNDPREFVIFGIRDFNVYQVFSESEKQKLSTDQVNELIKEINADYKALKETFNMI